MFNAAQIHLALNHLPVEGTLFGAAILIFGLLFKKGSVRRVGLAMLVFSALIAIPTLRSGEPAEDIAKKIPGISRQVIHEHEEAAEVALIMTLIVGAGALGTLVLRKFQKERFETQASAGVAVLSVVAFVLMARASHFGGLIRHEEIATEGAPAAGKEAQQH